MKKILFFITMTFLFSEYSVASVKEKIINKFISINNISFKFKQTIDQKEEEGSCIIKYSKKIYCSYNSKFNKILVSNGKSLVIKSDKNKQYYVYPLKKTPLDLILDKEFILKNIKKSEGRLVNNKYYNFSINNNGKIINIFFDNKNYNLLGWQTEDIYQNLTVTFIYDFKANQKIKDNLFNLPKAH
tara:strand:- start:1510 stop:2067 length:558 start_codon:yes stop_codon:yes gene_type:complete